VAKVKDHLKSAEEFYALGTRAYQEGRLKGDLGLKKGDKIRFSLEGSMIRLIIPKMEEDVVERTKGVLKGFEPELTPEELEEAFLTAAASKIKAKEEA